MRQSFSHSSEFNSSTARAVRAYGPPDGGDGVRIIYARRQRRRRVRRGKGPCNEKTLYIKRVIGLQKRVPRDPPPPPNIKFVLYYISSTSCTRRPTRLPRCARCTRRIIYIIIISVDNVLYNVIRIKTRVDGT